MVKFGAEVTPKDVEVVFLVVESASSGSQTIMLIVTHTETEGTTDGSKVLLALMGDVGPPVLDEILIVGKSVGPVKMLLLEGLGQLDEAIAVELPVAQVKILLFKEIGNPVDALKLLMLVG